MTAISINKLIPAIVPLIELLELMKSHDIFSEYEISLQQQIVRQPENTHVIANQLMVMIEESKPDLPQPIFQTFHIGTAIHEIEMLISGLTKQLEEFLRDNNETITRTED